MKKRSQVRSANSGQKVLAAAVVIIFSIEIFLLNTAPFLFTCTFFYICAMLHPINNLRTKIKLYLLLMIGSKLALYIVQHRTGKKKWQCVKVQNNNWMLYKITH